MNQSDIISISFTFLIYFSIGLLGAFTNDLYETVVKKDETIKIKRVFVGAITSGFIFLYMDPLISASVQSKIGLCFISGILGFEIFGNINRLSGLETFIQFIEKIRKK